jgi:hypothetical protein
VPVLVPLERLHKALALLEGFCHRPWISPACFNTR